MIVAILPVPIRVNIERPGSILDGKYTTSCFSKIPVPHEQEVVMGRSLAIPHLVFYKVFSLYGRLLIEHTFVGDSTFNLHDFNTGRNINTGAVHHTAPVLFPISVKQYHDEATTYLFVNNINYLLNKLYTWYELDFDIPQKIVSMGRYVSELFKTNNLDIVTEDPHWQPPIVEYNLRDRLTPELPTGVIASLEDYLGFENNGDGLWTYLNDIAHVDNPHAPLSYFIEPYLFSAPNVFDPITKLCISTPSHITADQLRPYVTDIDQLIRTKDTAVCELEEDANLQGTSLINWCKQFTSNIYAFTDLIEFFSISKYTDITLRITKTGASVVCNYNRFVDIGDIGIFEGARSKTPILTNTVEGWLLGSDVVEIVVCKTWLDELFVNRVKSNGIVETLYTNINLYHLVSPSLVNRDRLDYLTQVRNTYI